MENKNVILAIVLSAAIMIIWTVFIQAALPPAGTMPQQAAQQAQQAPAAGPQAAQQDAGRKVVSREEALEESARVSIDNPRLRGSINLKGARLDDLILKDYRETVDPTSPNIVLLSPRETQNGYYADIGWFREAARTSSCRKGNRLAGGRRRAVAGQAGHADLGQRPRTDLHPQVRARCRLHVHDHRHRDQRRRRASRGRPYGRIDRYGTPKDASQSYVLHEGPIGELDGTLKEESYSSVKCEGGKKVPSSPTPRPAAGWASATNTGWWRRSRRRMKR